MLLRKVNAGFSLFATYLLLDHAIFHAIWMLSQGKVAKTANQLPWILLFVMAVHAMLSIVLAVLGHKGAKKCKCNSYPRQNVFTVVQRFSGLAMILFSALHILGTIGVLTPPQAVHAVLPVLFFAITLAHLAVSGSKALITLGIGNAKVVKTVDVVMKVLCGATWIADVVGFYLYLV